MNQPTKMSRLPVLPLTLLLFIVPVAGATGTMPFCLNGITQQNANPFEDHIKRGKAAYEAKNYAVARNEARAALQLNKESPEANLLLAFAARGLRKADDAMKYAKKAIQYRQDYADAHFLLAVLLYEKSNLDKAAGELEKAMQQGARYATAFILKGTLEIRADQWQAALDSYKEALRLAEPNAPSVATIKERVAALEATTEFLKHKDDPAYTGPKPLNAPMPSYTQDARDHHVQGVVKAAVFINEEGRVMKVVLLTTLGHGLDAEAMRAAGQLLFAPATKDGKAIPCWQSVAVEFNLR